jgi:hypothetical protein
MCPINFGFWRTFPSPNDIYGKNHGKWLIKIRQITMKNSRIWYSQTKMINLAKILTPYQHWVMSIILGKYSTEYGNSRILIHDKIKFVRADFIGVSRRQLFDTFKELVEMDFIKYESVKGRAGGYIISLTDKLFKTLKRKNWEG